MKQLSKKREILKGNPMIDQALVRNFERLDAQLQRLGVVLKPKYSLEPPLASLTQQLCNDSSSPIKIQDFPDSGDLPPVAR